MREAKPSTLAKRDVREFSNQRAFIKRLLPLLLFAAVYILFTLSDLQSSTQTGFRDANRSSAHFFLVALTGYLLVYVFFNAKTIARITLRQPLSGLIVLAGWIFLVSLHHQAGLWTLLVQMNMSVLWVLVYVFFWDYTRRGGANALRVSSFSTAMLVFYVCATLYYFVDVSVRLGRTPVLNVVYYAEAILPWVILTASPKRRDICFLLTVAAVFVSLKRTAILALPLMYALDIFFRGRGTKVKIPFTKKWGKLIVISVLFIVAFVVVDWGTNGFLSQRFSSEEMATGSGRTDYWARAISAISQRGLFELLVGGGAGSSVNLLGTGVHNEWLEMLFSYGVFGLAIYSSIIVGMMFRLKSVTAENPEYAPACAMMFALYLVLSMLSTGYGGYSGVFLFGFWGYLEGLVIAKKKGLLGNVS